MENALFDGELVASRRILHTPSAFARANLIHLQEVGRLQARQPHASARSGLCSYLFFVVLSGAGELEYEGRTWPLTTGDCVFLDCGKPYLHRTGADLWQLAWVHFYGPNTAALYRKYRERGGAPQFAAQAPARYAGILEEIYALAGQDSPVQDMLIYGQLVELLTALLEEGFHPELRGHGGAKKQSVQQVKDYLDQHYADKITLDALAGHFFINKFYLTRVFKEQFGVSVNGYLTQLRITHAKHMLRFTDADMETIAQSCGLGDANYFARTFKKIEGLSPGEFRRQW